MPADGSAGSKSPRLGGAALQVALNALLETHPDAWVAAIKPSGYFTTMPDSVPLRGQRVIQGPSSALELVVPDDRNIVVDAWSRTLSEGGATALVRPYGGAHREIGMHFFDLVDRYGVLVGVFLGFGRNDELEADAQPPPVPRTSVFRKDQVGVITAVDDAATAILGWSADELLGHRSLEFIHPDDQDRAVANWMEMLSRPGSSQRIRLRQRHKDGTWIWLEITNHNQLGDADDPVVLADVVDVTEEVTAHEALRANERLLRRLTEALPVGVLYVGADGQVSYGNERLASMVGVGWAGTVGEQFATAVQPDRDALLTAVSTVLRRGRDLDLSVTFVPKPDTRVYCDVSLRPLINEAGEVIGAIVCVADITEDIKLREELRDRARYDLLTGCLNHASVMAALGQRLSVTPVGDPRATGLTVAIFIDLDDFKGINDRHGHAAGDKVLRHVADRLHEVAGEDDLVGRLGGDEFLVVLSTSDGPRVLTGIAGRVSAALNRTIAWEGGWILPRASIGLSSTRAGAGVSADVLVSVADAAMYQSKRRNGSPVIAPTSLSS